MIKETQTGNQDHGEPNVDNLKHGQNKASINVINLVTQWNHGEFSVEVVGENPNIVLVGESHYISSMDRQVELAALLQCELVLHETFTCWTYNPQTKSYLVQEGRYINASDEDEVKWTDEKATKFFTAAAELHGFTLIGCNSCQGDWENIEKEFAAQHPDRFEYDQQYDLLVKKGDDDWISGLDEEFMAFARPRREKIMLDTIVQASKLSSKPIVVILGFNHPQSFHEQGTLNSLGLDYVHVHMGDTISP